ncbi:MAG: C4-dicarboxylate ABC transporter permease, partial [Clostridia bacterium]|nr:C4-dicarboxylate ABC transporter permease [Clostridia bacterium]
GSYAVEKNIVHVVFCLIFGLLGWMMKKYKYPAAPVVLGVVLGKLMETNFSQIPVVGKGSWAGLYNRPLTIILFVISIAAIAWPMIQDHLNKKKAQ